MGHKWEGVTRSIKLGDRMKAVVLYSRRNCTGERKVVEESSADLGTFQEQTRSIRGFGSVSEELNADIIDARIPDVIPSGESTKDHDKFHLSQTVITTVILVPIIAAILFIVLAIVRSRRARTVNWKHEMKPLPEKEIQEFINGMGLDLAKNQDHDDYSVELIAQNKPYDDLYEIPRSQIKFGSLSYTNELDHFMQLFFTYKWVI